MEMCIRDSAGKQENGHHQNAEKYWENQQTREVLQEDEEHPFAAAHMLSLIHIYAAMIFGRKL